VLIDKVAHSAEIGLGPTATERCHFQLEAMHSGRLTVNASERK
jgi:hypothetical protein